MAPALKTWDELQALASSDHRLERKEALSQARIHLIHCLERHGCSVADGQVRNALVELAQTGTVDGPWLGRLLRAISLRNRVEYEGTNPQPAEVLSAFKAMREFCETWQAAGQRRSSQLRAAATNPDPPLSQAHDESSGQGCDTRVDPALVLAQSGGTVTAQREIPEPAIREVPLVEEELIDKMVGLKS